MVEVVEFQDLAFMGTWKYNSPRECISDKSRDEDEEKMDDEIASNKE